MSDIIDSSNAYEYKDKKNNFNKKEGRKQKSFSRSDSKYSSTKPNWMKDKSKDKRKNVEEEWTQRDFNKNKYTGKVKKEVVQVAETEKTDSLYEFHANKKNEFLYYGIHMCEALFANRKDEIIKVYITKENIPTFSQMLKFCGQQKRAYKVIEDVEIQKITGATHHEGIAVVTKSKRAPSIDSLEKSLKKSEKPILLLDDVKNPHNIGTIMRIMAHFGWEDLVVAGGNISLTQAMARTSEGGAEFVNLYDSESILDFAHILKKNGYTLVGTSSHSSKSLFEYKFPKKLVLVLGQEANGIGQELQKLLDDSIIIPGTNNVESLNVSTASAIFLGEYARQMSKK